MATLQAMEDEQVWPAEIRLLENRRALKIKYKNDEVIELSAEYLRVFSPSAEVQGHAPDQRKTQYGKRNVEIIDVKPVGNYAIKLFFDDLHVTGIYTWQYLHELHKEHEHNWHNYLQELNKKGLSRDFS
ncbi:gamma-butyrobetaine hydroxylase-like domain-containing protein [Polycladidibacter stylochi]|uniref:gamma-butyrobetaine hydroxylase-like domain-containing protein n=1 Tax=Polycladidibacter stylochi TaxID=1807766 RepID=UPI000ABA4526|nr:DUF971 domain-containing protein [Pseudovibrio stylochi]